MDKIPANLILFLSFNNHDYVNLKFNESFYIAALAPPVAGAATALVAMAAPPTMPPTACPYSSCTYNPCRNKRYCKHGKCSK